MTRQLCVRVIPNFFYFGEEGGGAKLLVEAQNMAVLQSFTLGESGRMLPHEILGVLRCILRHTEKHTEFLEKRLIIIIITAC